MRKYNAEWPIKIEQKLTTVCWLFIIYTFLSKKLWTNETNGHLTLYIEI